MIFKCSVCIKICSLLEKGQSCHMQEIVSSVSRKYSYTQYIVIIIFYFVLFYLIGLRMSACTVISTSTRYKGFIYCGMYTRLLGNDRERSSLTIVITG